MHASPAARLLLPLLGAAVALTGCGDGGDGHDHDHGVDAPASVDAAIDGPAATGAVTLAFEHLVAGAPVTMGTDTPYTNTAGNSFGVSLVRYFISDVTLVFADGSQRQFPGAHYVDHDVAATRSYQLATDVPAGPLTTIRFVMGLPPALNVTGAFTTAPESLMEWPVMMGGGYHYMKFEGRYINSAAAPFNFKVHSGGLGGTDYSFVVELDASGRAVSADGTTLTLEMNLERWFGSWNLNDYFNAGHPGIMGDAAAQASLRQNGATVFTLDQP